MLLRSWDVPIEYLSPSSIGKLVLCPEQWRQRYLLKQKEKCGPDMFMGIVDHETHALNFKQKIETGTDLDTLDMVNLYDKVWVEQDEEELPEFYDTDPAALQNQGRDMVAVYHSFASPKINPIRVEERFEVKITGVPVPVIGYTDVEEKHKLLERKTTKSKLKDPKPNWRMQGRIYSLVYSKPVEYHLITKTKIPQIVTSEQEPGLWMEPGHQDSTVELLQHAAYMLNDLYARYGPDRPWPQNGLFHQWACGYCSFGPKYGKTCPAWEETE